MYLKTLFFGISANPEGTQLLEVIFLASHLNFACVPLEGPSSPQAEQAVLLTGVHILIQL